MLVAMFCHHHALLISRLATSNASTCDSGSNAIVLLGAIVGRRRESNAIVQPARYLDEDETRSHLNHDRLRRLESFGQFDHNPRSLAAHAQQLLDRFADALERRLAAE
jgi:hypothetical protein